MTTVTYLAEYKSTSGRVPVTEWYSKRPPDHQAELDTFFEMTLILGLIRPNYRVYSMGKRRDNLLEGRCKHYRLFCHIFTAGVLTYLSGCSKQGTGKFKPANSDKTAFKRRDQILKGEASVCELQAGRLA